MPHSIPSVWASATPPPHRAIIFNAFPLALSGTKDKILHWAQMMQETHVVQGVVRFCMSWHLLEHAAPTLTLT